MPRVKKMSPAVKLNVTIREDLLERTDAFAENNGMTRSGLIAVALTNYLNAMDAMPSTKKLLNAMAAVSDGLLKGEMPMHEAKARMESIRSTYEELSNGA